MLARQVTDAAYANPEYRCPTCHNTLDKCGPRGDGRNANGSPCTWDGGHRKHGDPRFGYHAQCSHCNRSEGATMGNANRREPHSERW